MTPNNPTAISEICRNYRLCGLGKVESYIRAVKAQCSHDEMNRRMVRLCRVIGGWDFSQPDGCWNRGVSKVQ